MMFFKMIILMCCFIIFSSTDALRTKLLFRVPAPDLSLAVNSTSPTTMPLLPTSKSSIYTVPAKTGKGKQGPKSAPTNSANCADQDIDTFLGCMQF